MIQWNNKECVARCTELCRDIVAVLDVGASRRHGQVQPIAAQRDSSKSASSIVRRQSVQSEQPIYIWPAWVRADYEQTVEVQGQGYAREISRRDEPRHVFVEERDGSIRMFRAAGFHSYFTARDPTAAFTGTLRHTSFAEQETREHAVEQEIGEEENQKDKNREEREERTTMAAKRRRKFHQRTPERISSTTENPATMYHGLKYLDKDMWGKSLAAELDKVDANGTIRWLKLAELNFILKDVKIIPMTFSLNLKRNKDRSIEERKRRASLRRDTMQKLVHYKPEHTSEPMVVRVAARMVASHSVKEGWHVGHFDMTSAFLHEEYKYPKPVYIREMAREDGFYKHGNTVGVLMLNLYGNPSGIYYYVDGLPAFLPKIHAKLNEADVCLVRIEFKSGSVIMAVAVDDFPATASTMEAMDELYSVLKEKYKAKRLGRPKQYLGWNFHYEKGEVALGWNFHYKKGKVTQSKFAHQRNRTAR